MDMRLAFILVLGLAGCAGSETVYLERVSQGGILGKLLVEFRHGWSHVEGLVVSNYKHLRS